MSYWPLYSRRGKETRSKWQLWKWERLHSCLLGRHWTLSWGIESQNGETINSFLQDGMKIIFFFFFLGFYWAQILNLTAYRIQSVHWIYHFTLFVHQETKKQGQTYCYEKGNAFTSDIGWKDCELFPEGIILSLLLARQTFNFFQMVWIKKMVRKYINWTFLGK